MDSGIEGDSMFLVGSVANVPTDGTPIRASRESAKLMDCH
jgi:hypothetical protein